MENIQREDLNDVDRAAGLLRLRDLMQEELDKAHEEAVAVEQPWGNKMTWAKVGQRLGYSRQRIHQLIQLLNLPDEIKDDVRDGRISERDTRMYQGLKPSQQRALHKARIAGDISTSEAKDIARILKENPDLTVYQTIRALREPAAAEETPWEKNAPDLSAAGAAAEPRPPHPFALEDSMPDQAPGASRITNMTRLSYVRQHLARIQRQGLAAHERHEVLRLLRLIEQDVRSLIGALETDS